ncbi:hypothetical protein 7t3_0447 [Salmonella phage 7t3]|nr:hypothetical protein 7t3_0447 [Salmonella phage 7t3]
MIEFYYLYFYILTRFVEAISSPHRGMKTIKKTQLRI